MTSPARTHTLPAALRLGAVHLTVTDLERSLDWYRHALGLHSTGKAELGDGVETLVHLHEDSEANRAGRHAGLYHYALLFPSREELARAALRIATTQTPVQGMSDHGTHEAIYLPDPDGNGIELAADRPRGRWPTDAYAGGPAPLDLESLLDTISGEEPTPQVAEGLRVGHMHLYVGDVDEGLAFYRDVLGFELQANIGTAAFVSAGGYHHHLAFNVWNGRGVGAAPPHTVGLDHWTLQLPDDADVDDVRSRIEAVGLQVEPVERGFRVDDPWGIALQVESVRSPGSSSSRRER
jgi:catechol 2,3-dioxygenase